MIRHLVPDTDELPDAAYLYNLASRLMHVPVMYGTDQGDCDRLADIAAKLERQNLSNKSEA